MADDAEAGDPGPAAAPDPALNYPRGNRLGNRHPRPTSVIVLAVILVVGGAWAWQTLQRTEWMFCDLAMLVGAPTASSPEGAVQAWLDQTQKAGTSTKTRYGTLPAPTSIDDFTREGDSWIYRVGDQGVKVDVGPGYQVTAANSCGWQQPP